MFADWRRWVDKDPRWRPGHLTFAGQPARIRGTYQHNNDHSPITTPNTHHN